MMQPQIRPDIITLSEGGLRVAMETPYIRVHEHELDGLIIETRPAPVNSGCHPGCVYITALERGNRAHVYLGEISQTGRLVPTPATKRMAFGKPARFFFKELAMVIEEFAAKDAAEGL